ncbi:hypothetical protein GS597_10750 [Synechococcales cyanobacterium C]|uniref:Uncharacterized protein n=1 Tax=Petrachloros mirabilis ULC683 TaxID=2781853 RepID=A0A8K1ZY17_9CYAN|nr:hypothetical protein [Petrachloros mirabilis]NCJ06978.1 hypothetical protein [Petrachloros mirabilis ULC683]
MSSPSANSAPQSKRPLDLEMGLASLPLLVGLAIQQRSHQWLQSLGQWSEEIFRGEQLPPLPFPPPEASE